MKPSEFDVTIWCHKCCKNVGTAYSLRNDDTNNDLAKCLRDLFELHTVNDECHKD